MPLHETCVEKISAFMLKFQSNKKRVTEIGWDTDDDDSLDDFIRSRRAKKRERRFNSIHFFSFVLKTILIYRVNRSDSRCFVNYYDCCYD